MANRSWSVMTEAQKEMQRVYHRKYEKTPKGYLQRMYRNMLSRVKGISPKGKEHYIGKQIVDKNEFYVWGLNNKTYLSLLNDYEMSGYDLKKAPSIERIDSSKGYEMNNIEIITHSENSRRGAKNQKAGSSGYKGVSSRPNGRFYVTHSSGSHGGFSCKHEAARVWNTVSRMFNGPNAFMNTVTNA